ncbi:hypothetical protein MANES_15G173066v8 [Manihot esculenta]|uniref:Uncharacterized protein n=1 Tax=Manihot esculenta TaxID=3983 RepID=A0ACB7GD83_MANES|nr:hypothetical protein MANES_15G173066v8 [Manihot esculenta]
MTRSVVVSQELVQIAELEEQVQMLLESTQKNGEEFKEFKEEVRKNSQHTNTILDELRALMIEHVARKGKETGSSSEGGSRSKNRILQLDSMDSKGMLSNQKENQPMPANDKGILGTLPNSFCYNEMTQMLSKIELVSFEGKEPRAWLRKCVKYFEIYRVPAEQRNRGGEHAREEFERGICNKFGDEGLDDIIEGFMKLRQDNTVEEYQDERFVFSLDLLGDLKDKIRLTVKMIKPVSLAQAVEIARLQEQLVDKNQLKGNPNSFKPFKPSNISQTTHVNPANTYSKPYQTYQYSSRPLKTTKH